MSDQVDQAKLDPTKVTRVALENAGSIAGLMLTTECMITDPEEEKGGMGSADVAT
ncbi:hypothetical protein ACFVX6_17930 [Streptomyces sp. NPDC058289]|uniref:hypothetical protein n=1 Tax=Streptomyces sp. NPDC058289 TaxID=3346425 RepID=UPI0036E7C5C7